MTSPSDHEDGPPDPRVDLSKGDPAADAPFDPYRFGLPDKPVPPEFAPPGYTPPPTRTPPAGTATPYPGPPPASTQVHYPPPYDSSQYPYGAPPYGAPPPYGPPPPYGAPAPYYPGYSQPGGSNGKAITALVLGIVSIVMFWTSIFDAIFVIIALIFGIIGLNEANSRHSRGKGMAIAGLICAGVGTVLAIVWTVFIVHAANKCGGFDQQNSPGYQHCLRDNL